MSAAVYPFRIVARGRRRQTNPPAMPPFDTMTLGNRLQILAIITPLTLRTIEKLVELWVVRPDHIKVIDRQIDSILRKAPEPIWPYAERP